MKIILKLIIVLIIIPSLINSFDFKSSLKTLIKSSKELVENSIKDSFGNLEDLLGSVGDQL